MKKEFIEMRDAQLLSKQRVWFRAFVVNTLLVLFIWLMTFIPAFIYLGVLVTGVSAPMFYVYAIGTLAVWGLAGVVLFLGPAIAVWWERKMVR